MLHRALISLRLVVSAAECFGMRLLYDRKLCGERASQSSGALAVCDATLLCVAGAFKILHRGAMADEQRSSAVAET